jgi:two-component system, OmpR family, phosphate regulon sensor histidine kinase PhoR
MPYSDRRWLLLAWPLLGLVLAWILRAGIVWQYESVWRLNQNQVVSEEMEFFRRLAESSGSSANQMMQIANASTDGQLILIPDSDGTLDRKLVRGPSIEWYVEPDGFRRVRAIRSVVPKEGEPYWLVFSRRVPPVDQKLFAWSTWLLPIGFVVGLSATWSGFRKTKLKERVLRSLSGLRNPARSNVPREAMMEMFPNDAFEPEVHRELISLVESFQSTYSDIQSDAEQSQSVLAAMPVGILAFTTDLRLTFANRAGIDMLELSEPVRVDARLIELIRQPKVIEVVSESQNSGQTLDSELERNQGNTVLRLRAYPLSSEVERGAKPPMLLIVTDETRLRQLENARRDFTANVSHELKTPLAAIKAYAETLLMGAMDDPDAKERFVRRISEQAARLDNLIRDLLQLTKIQSLPERISLTSMSVSEIVRTSVDEHLPIAASKQVQLVNNAADEALRVMAEYEAVRTILSNLLTNAIRYSKPGGQVEVEAVRLGDWIDISVIDNGIGIPESDLDRIFERFYRVDKARSADAGGTGLGLSIVKHMVQALGGSIRVRSRLGVGSEFTFRLEVSRPERDADNDG